MFPYGASITNNIQNNCYGTINDHITYAVFHKYMRKDGNHYRTLSIISVHNTGIFQNIAHYVIYRLLGISFMNNHFQHFS